MSTAADPAQAMQQATALIKAGQFAAALRTIDGHLGRHPQDARGWGLAAYCRRHLADLVGARAAAERALRLQPEFPAALLELAQICAAQGDAEARLALLRRCVALDPGNRAARWELAQALAGRDPVATLALLAPLLDQAGAPAEVWSLQLELLARRDDTRGLLDTLATLLRREPDRVDLLEAALRRCPRSTEGMALRVALARQLARIAPSATRWLDCGRELQESGDFVGAFRAAQTAAAVAPGFLPARWAAFQWPPGPAPADDAEADQYRHAWDAGLGVFEASDLARRSRDEIWGCVGQCTAFYRHYLGDELADPGRYGRLVHRMMALLDAGEPLRPLREGRRRIGVCTAHLREHTVARLFVPLLESLDRQRFELVVFSLADGGDRWSQRLRACAAEFHAQPTDAPGWRQRIAAAELDVLVYPEIGMDPTTQALAALRLAPLQVALWGHPVSTGLPSIDLFLSADALEPADAGDRYSETLVRLPGLGHGLREADLPTPRDPALWPPDPQRIELLCAQTVFKLLPRQDRLFARLLAALPEARLHLLADHRPAVRDWLRQRMAPTLAAAGADPVDQLHVHGFLDHARYLGLAGVCRLNLDSVGWSGGMSALDLLAQGLPTLCLPGESMRSRQTAALLERLELPELIAADEDDYVAKAITLARDPARCAALSATLRERRGRLFAEPAAAAALNALLAGVQRLPDGSLRLP